MSYSYKHNQKAKLAAEYNDLLKELSSPNINTIGCYSLGETIGYGSYGKVKLGTHQLTGQTVAIKKISKKHAALVAREIHHHQQLKHKNIVALYEILSTETYIYIVSEHCPKGDLLDALSLNKRYSEDEARKWFHQLIDAIQYCHSRDIIHRDLKLENILLDQDDNVKICDFGFARQTDKNQLLKTFCGSVAYSAPEVIQCQQYSGPSTDIWSLGVILYTLLAGELPFDDECEIAMQRKIIRLDYVMPSFFSNDLVDLMSKILRQNPLDRMTLSEIINHPWMKMIGKDIPSAPCTIAHNKKIEEDTASSLLKAGFDKSVVNSMRNSNMGMLGTLWTMLVSSHKPEEHAFPNKSNTLSCATQTEQEDKSWLSFMKTLFSFISPDIPKSHLYTHELSPMCDYYLSLSPCSSLSSQEDDYDSIDTSGQDDYDSIDTSGQDDYDSIDTSGQDDDHDSLESSPATSIDEEEYTPYSAMHEHHLPNYYNRLSYMHSRTDIPRHRYFNEDKYLPLRDRLGKKIIMEEDEEE